jgi:hypothetical protein
MIGNEEDFTASLGFEVKGADHSALSHIETEAFKAMIETAVKEFPELQGGRHHAAPGHHRHQERLERDPLARRQIPREPQVSRSSKSSTASAEATASPADSSLASSPRMTPNWRSTTVRPTARSRRPLPATRPWPRRRKSKN